MSVVTTKKGGLLVGVIHLAALPGSPGASRPLRDIVAECVQSARVLAAEGFDLCMVENYGDVPFFRGAVPPVTTAAMTLCAAAVRDAAPGLPLGVNVLRNDALTALSIAHVVGAACVRVNVLTGARVTDQGVIEGAAAELLRARASLGAGGVAIWADVDVKHSSALAPQTLAQETSDLVVRALADAVLVTGPGTGLAADTAKLREVSLATRASARPGVRVPVLVASGATVASLPTLAEHADGVIVGSALRADGHAGGPIDAGAAATFAAAFRRAFPR
ncbi:MAG: BtpA/SgcQ family protein [Myxococcales bacterium]|jgi:membrane complex biogenesis BtpA family protein|nr:BtpA/SgcQ family protein [Myxococcales bacterium]MBL0196707.1 BtpA/SgcQ family protein [Myxococcales bacterium]